MKLIVIGAGWAGVAAAYQGAKRGFEVILIERTDMILGTGLVGGIVRNNGRFTALEELRVAGANEFIDAIDSNCRHTNINFPGHANASLYDVTKIDKAILDLLKKYNVNLLLETRISKVNMDGKRIISVIADDNREFVGDIFIDATGTFGPMNNCNKYGNGCAMCVLRCPSFKGRVSLTGLCGITELQGKKKDGSIGAMSGSCKLHKESLDKTIVDILERDGVVIIPLPSNLIEDHLDIKACQQYALNEYRENIILLDTGYAKMMTPFFPLNKLRRVKGLENARYADPYSGGIGNSMRFFAIAPHENNLRVIGIDNLLCAGEKTGMVGHTEAIFTGFLSAYNAKRLFDKEKLLIFPKTTVIGESIDFTNKQLKDVIGITKKYTASGSVLFEQLKKLDLYTVDKQQIEDRIKKLRLKDIFL